MNYEEVEKQMERGLAKAKEYAEQTGQKEEDMLFSLAPGDERVKSVQEFNAAGKTMPFVCMRADQPAPIPGCCRIQCDGCRHEVWMSPATKTIFEKVDRKLVICLECLSEQLKEK